MDTSYDKTDYLTTTMTPNDQLVSQLGKDYSEYLTIPSTNEVSLAIDGTLTFYRSILSGSSINDVMLFWGIFYPPCHAFSCILQHCWSCGSEPPLPPPPPLRHDVIYGRPLFNCKYKLTIENCGLSEDVYIIPIYHSSTKV